jgi:hypothetical protein
MQVTESAADGGFTATASLERDGARVEGKAGYGGSKKTARQAAALALLAALTGLAVPADNRVALPVRRNVTSDSSRLSEDLLGDIAARIDGGRGALDDLGNGS